jgi:hypothetical protein
MDDISDRREAALLLGGLGALFPNIRRLSKDYEYNVQTSETLIDIAATRLILNRLASA